MNSIYPHLSEQLTISGISPDDLATHLNINIDTLCLKMKGLLSWELSEAIDICVLLKSPDVKFLFCTVR